MTALAWLQLPRPTRTGTVYMGVCAGLVAAGGVAAVASARHGAADNGTVAALLVAGLLALWPLTGLLLARLLRRPHILPARRTPVSPQLPSDIGPGPHVVQRRRGFGSARTAWRRDPGGVNGGGSRRHTHARLPPGRVRPRAGFLPPLPALGHPTHTDAGPTGLPPADPANRDHQLTGADLDVQPA